LPLRCIYSILDKADGVVIDPYCGSGTTCVAAKLLGKDYIGIDISQDYTEMAENRLKKYKSEQEIYFLEIEKHKVNKTFKQRKEEGKFVGKFRKKEKSTDKEQLF
jgi:site-specific DNA-methyltransferase (adenine-specific)